MIELTQACRDAGLQARIFAFASVFNGNRREKSRGSRGRLSDRDNLRGRDTAKSGWS